MPRNNCDPEPTPGEPVPMESGCPKCGAVMEPIEAAVEGLQLEDLQLCPHCYLVIWRDQGGFQTRQGVPMKNGAGGWR
jgi:hypothetical protein